MSNTVCPKGGVHQPRNPEAAFGEPSKLIKVVCRKCNATMHDYTKDDEEVAFPDLNSSTEEK
jgi:hypothetical protein